MSYQATWDLNFMQRLGISHILLIFARVSHPNHQHSNIRMHILHTVLYTFPKVLTRRICLTIKNYFIWWSFPLFLQLYVWFRDDMLCWEIRQWSLSRVKGLKQQLQMLSTLKENEKMSFHVHDLQTFLFSFLLPAALTTCLALMVPCSVWTSQLPSVLWFSPVTGAGR